MPTNFPAITLCNQNAYDLTNLSNLVRFFKKLDDLGMATLKENMLGLSFKEKNDRLELIKSMVYTTKKMNLTDKISLGFSLKRMLLSCWFDDKLCSEDDFTQFQSVEYGNCFTFNGFKSNQTLKSTITSGINTGLNIELFVGFNS